ncbi:MAG: hypothetical protein ACLPY1_25625 [Terracidiphilus sp.]
MTPQTRVDVLHYIAEYNMFLSFDLPFKRPTEEGIITRVLGNNISLIPTFWILSPSPTSAFYTGLQHSPTTLLALLPCNFNDRACSDRLRLAGLDVPRLSWYAVGLIPPGLLFGLAAFDKRTIQRGVARMAVALDGKGARLSN